MNWRVLPSGHAICLDCGAEHEPLAACMICCVCGAIQLSHPQGTTDWR
jgi:hypothetical protein